MKKLITLVLSLLLMATMAANGQAKNQPTSNKPLELKLATHALPTHFLMAKGVFPEWKERIEKETGGRVKIKIYDSQSLGKIPDEWNMLKAGVSDIGWIVFPFYKGVFPLSEVVSQPGLKPKEGQELAYYNALFSKYLNKEYSEVKAFFPNILGNTYLNTKKAVRNLSDLKGMQIRCGSTQKDYIKALGATPVTLPPSELYTALERGIVEGCTFPLDGVKSYKLYEVSKFHTQLNLGLGMNVTAMNLKVWNSLPQDIQKVFTDLNPWLQEKMYKANYDDGKEALDEIIKNGGEVITLSTEEEAKFDQIAASMANDWAKEMDSKGMAGTEILNYARSLLGK